MFPMFCRAALRTRHLANVLDQASYTPIFRRMMASSKKGNGDNLIVQHDLHGRSFFIPLAQSEKKAVLHYTLPKENVIDLQSTLVPEEFRGQGVAAKLVESALDYAADNDLKVKLTCWYTAEYVENNQEKIQNSEKLKDLKFV